MKVRVRFKESKSGEHLIHHIQLKNVPIENFKKVEDKYNLDLKRKGKNGSIRIHIQIHERVLKKKRGKRLPHISIAFIGDYANVEINQLFKQKIKKEKDHYKISYSNKDKMSVEVHQHIQESAFEELYGSVIRKIEKRKKLFNPKAPIKNQVNLSEQQEGQNDKRETSKSGQKVWTAKDSSFRRCGNCHFYSQRNRLCGLFSRKTTEDKACGRFYAPRYRIQSGGGFSPK